MVEVVGYIAAAGERVVERRECRCHVVNRDAIICHFLCAELTPPVIGDDGAEPRGVS